MADQGKWFKLWCSALEDQFLENLELEDWARWARLGAFIKRHGNGGELGFSAPCRALQNLFRVTTFQEVIEALLRMPNILLSTAPIRWPHGRKKPPACQGQIVWGYWYLNLGVETPPSPGVDTPPEEGVKKVFKTSMCFVSFINWSKYQDDFKNDRRVGSPIKNPPQEEKRRDVEVEEKRNPLNPRLPSATSTATANDQKPDPKAEQEAAKKLLRTGRKSHDFAIPDSEIMGPEEFTKIKAAIRPQPAAVAAKTGDDDVF